MQPDKRTHYLPERERIEGVFSMDQPPVLETASEATDTLCTDFMFYNQRLASPLTVDFHFVIVRDLEPNLQVCTVYNTIYLLDSFIFVSGSTTEV